MRFARFGPVGRRDSPCCSTRTWLRPAARSPPTSTATSSPTTASVARGRRSRAGSLDLVEDVDALRVGPPIARPGKIVCIGLNYRDHADETNAQIPDEPVVFMKDPHASSARTTRCSFRGSRVKTDWEVELGVS